MLKTTLLNSARPGRTKLDKNRLNTNSSGGIGSGVGGEIGDGGIKNLSNVKKSAKSKKFDFVKAKSLGADFLTSGVKETFIHL